MKKNSHKTDDDDEDDEDDNDANFTRVLFRFGSFSIYLNHKFFSFLMSLCRCR